MPAFDLNNPTADFSYLSIDDLLRARDQFHHHLMRKKHVVATAVGYYLIRKTDPYPERPSEKKYGQTSPKKPSNKPERTLWNSEIRSYSWPCVLVFVDEWVMPGKPGQIPETLAASDLVEKYLETSDGKTIPVCLVKAPLAELLAKPLANPIFPDRIIGGGFPVIATVQQRDHLASIGCLVTDGHKLYALTNRHVSGAVGESIHSLLAGKRVEIGRSSEKQLSRVPFETIYSRWPAKNVYLNMDVGLIEINDANQWTAQIYGLGQPGRLADLGAVENYLRLVGCPVRAYGCASGQMNGTIWALFYRYKAVGGFEYVSDFLIGPRLELCEPYAKNQTFSTHPGDSGTVWLLETGDGRGLLPMAVQWGGQVFAESGSEQSFALATGLSNVCNLLDVELVRDLNLIGTEYWGATGHFTIANKAVGAITSKKLKQLMKANLERITFSSETLIERAKKHFAGLSKEAFIPLADVPDFAWKIGAFNRGGPEHPNHFADMDKPSPEHHGKTLLQLCKADTNNINVDFWLEYYHAVGDTSKGLLPFRVWQFYQEMVKFVSEGRVNEFVCAAGILAHYIGDACQPLHISFLFNGDPEDTVTVVRKGKPVEIPRADGVHHAYEADMVDFHVNEIMDGIGKSAPGNSALPKVKTGHDAAIATVDLMQKTFATLKPREIIDVFNEVSDQTKKQVADALWDAFGPQTIKVMTEGSRYLALLWQSAWNAGGGNSTIADLGAIDEDTLAGIYAKKTFMESKTLDHIKDLLDG